MATCLGGSEPSVRQMQSLKVLPVSQLSEHSQLIWGVVESLCLIKALVWVYEEKVMHRNFVGPRFSDFCESTGYESQQHSRWQHFTVRRRAKRGRSIQCYLLLQQIGHCEPGMRTRNAQAPVFADIFMHYFHRVWASYNFVILCVAPAFNTVLS